MWDLRISKEEEILCASTLRVYGASEVDERHVTTLALFS